MSEKEKKYNELKEKSLKILHFIETLVEENADGTVKIGDVMSLLSGTIYMFFRKNEQQFGMERAAEIKSAMMLLVKMA